MNRAPIARLFRAALGLGGGVAMLLLAAAVAVVGGPPGGAVPLDATQVELLADADPIVWAALAVRVAALCLASRWLAIMGAAWAAALRGDRGRAGRLAARLPAPLRLAVSISLSPMLLAAPSVAGAQQQPPTGVPTSVATAPADSAPPGAVGTTPVSSGVLELTPIPSGPGSNAADARAPTVGTAPAPVLPTRPPAPDDPSDTRLAGTGPPACPTIVTRSDVHWFDQARAHLDDQLGRPSSEAEALAYWERCVTHNAARLPDPSEPDVIGPGQPLELPELPRTL